MRYYKWPNKDCLIYACAIGEETEFIRGNLENAFMENIVRNDMLNSKLSKFIEITKQEYDHIKMEML